MERLRVGRATEEEVAGLDEKVGRLVWMARARRTSERYKSVVEEFQVFSEWSGVERGKVFPAAEKTVERFVAYLEMTGSSGGVGEALAAISAWHKDQGMPSPVGGHRIIHAAKGAARVWAEAEREGRKRDPFPVLALKRWIQRGPGAQSLGGVTYERWLRDAAMVAVGLRLMLRPAEIAGIRRRDVRFDEKGWLWVKIKKRKNDQLGQRGWDPIEPVEGSMTCVVRLMRACLDGLKGSGVGPEAPIFYSLRTNKAISGAVVNTVVKYMVKETGGSEEVAGHSLRIGGCCMGMTGGLSMAELRAIGGWTSNAIRHYLRSQACAEGKASERMGF
jgi:hypothetical protein